MINTAIYCAGGTPAIQHAKESLQSMGFSIANTISWEIGNLLLDIPSFGDNNQLRTGGNIDTLLSALPKDITIWGGNLTHPAICGYKTVDILKDEIYLAKNAAITADCALQVAAPLLPTTWLHSPALVIGWGRIGKCLSKLLKDIGCDVTVAARNPTTRAGLQSMGYHTTDPENMHKFAHHYRIVFNTVPEVVIREENSIDWVDCIKIDLASKKGIAGENVVWARGLPGTYAPESSGRLIAETISRLWKEEHL